MEFCKFGCMHFVCAGPKLHYATAHTSAARTTIVFFDIRLTMPGSSEPIFAMPLQRNVCAGKRGCIILPA